MIIDRKMPNMDGIECIKSLRDIGYNNSIILTSGSQSINESNIDRSLLVDKILVKPYDFTELLEIIKKLLG